MKTEICDASEIGDASEVGELKPGDLLEDRYTVVRVLAQGGMSTVYEVADQRLPGRLVAKRMRPSERCGIPREEMETLFRREAEVLSKLSNPFLPKVTDYFESGGQRYLVEELVEGQTLEALSMRPETIRQSRVVGWAIQICQALQYLHDHGIIYRDLKPSNVMITPTDDIRLIDFGLVRFYTLGKTRDTIVMGTPGYAAPEQYGQGQTDPRSDIFSLGALMHQLLTGQDPAQRPFVFAPPREVNGQVSEHIDYAIRKAVQTDPEMRFESAEDMEQALLGQRPVPPQGEVFAFGLPAEPVRPTALATAACAGIGVSALWLLPAAPITAFVTLGLLPVWLAILWRRYVEQKRLATLALKVEPDGLLLFEGQQKTRYTWHQLKEVRYCQRALDLTPMLCLTVGSRQVKLPIGKPALRNLSEVHGLPGAERLGRLLIDLAGLELTEPGGRVYR